MDQGQGCRVAATGTGLRCLARCMRRRDFCDRSGCPERPHRRDAGSEPVGLELDHLAVHRAGDHPWRVRSVMAQGPDECLRAPAPERRVVDKALPAWGPPGGSGHVGLDRGRLYETKMKASLSRWSAMKGRRFVIRMWRRSATSLRFCSRACRSCFMRRPESVRHPPNRGAADRDAMGLGRVQHELIECDPALRANTGLDPVHHSHARRHCPEVVGATVPSHVVVSPGHSRIPEKGLSGVSGLWFRCCV